MVSSFSNDMTYANVHVQNPMLRTAAGSSESFTNTAIQGRTKNKFQQGFLGGCGSASQFQGVNQALPVMPARSNIDVVDRILSSNGYRTGTPLQPSWERSYGFAPGRGVDARLSDITFTDKEAGRDSITAVVGPTINAGIDRQQSGPEPPQRTYQGFGGQIQAPVVVTGGEAATASNAYIKSQKARGEKALAKTKAKRS